MFSRASGQPVILLHQDGLLLAAAAAAAWAEQTQNTAWEAPAHNPEEKIKSKPLLHFAFSSLSGQSSMTRFIWLNAFESVFTLFVFNWSLSLICQSHILWDQFQETAKEWVYSVIFFWELQSNSFLSAVCHLKVMVHHCWSDLTNESWSFNALMDIFLKSHKLMSLTINRC